MTLGRTTSGDDTQDTQMTHGTDGVRGAGFDKETTVVHDDLS